ncbi:MAG: hypothetical protein QOF86_378, partial [Baekduia sp.]|nr:hypothetical protein [Baekduia sp.]
TDGKSIALLDPTGKTTRTLGPGTGLVAATAVQGNDPVWLVTGTDDAAVGVAATAFDEGALAGRFAVAMSNGKPVALPEVP